MPELHGYIQTAMVIVCLGLVPALYRRLTARPAPPAPTAPGVIRLVVEVRIVRARDKGEVDPDPLVADLGRSPGAT